MEITLGHIYRWHATTEGYVNTNTYRSAVSDYITCYYWCSKFISVMFDQRL